MDIDTMKCSKYQPMIDLAVGGDLSHSEQEKLEHHLSECRTCSEEMKMAQSAYKRIAALGAAELKQPKPRRTIDAVLGRITVDQTPRDHSLPAWLGSVFDGIKAFNKPRLSFALSGVIVIGILFVLLTAIIYRSGTDNKYLESPYTSLQQGSFLVPSVSETEILIRFLETNLPEDELQKLKNLQQPFAQNGDMVIIEAQTLETLIRLLKNSQRLNRLLILRLLQRNPELRDIEISDGLNQSELKLLAKKRSELAKIIGGT